MADPSSLVDTARAAASALGGVRRSPGKGEAWVEAVCQAVEKERPESYDRMRRRLGFARRLADLAQLTEEQQAAVSVGLFLYSLMADLREEERTRPAQAWNEYLLRNVDWLAPALEVCHAARADWDEEASRPAIVGKVSVLFDRETLEDHKRPLEVMSELRADPPAQVVEEIAAILCTEEGQALCDRHFRRHQRNYKLDPAEIRRSLERLKPAVHRPLAEAVAAPARLASSMTHATARLESRREERPVDVSKATLSDAFERRRQALRSSTPAREDAPRSVADGQTEEEQPPATRRSGPEEEQPRRVAAEEAIASVEPVEDEPREIEPAAPERDAPRRRPPVDDWEDKMDNIRNIASARGERREEADISERLNDLRSQLRQIQRIAVEGEELLAALAPQLEEFSTWLTHLESMVQRWKGSQDGGNQQAA